MRFVFPTLEYKEKAIDFVEEFFCNNTTDIDGDGGLGEYIKELSYENWLKKLAADIDIANVPSPRVPALTYFCVRESDDRIVGIMDIRLALNDFLRTEGGHIGYAVRPSERRKGYATEMLMKALVVCKRIGINEVIVTCDKDNSAS